MRNAVIAGVVVGLLSGCFSYVEPALRRDSSGFLGCPEDQVAISAYSTGAAGLSPMRWTASGCGREFACTYWVPGSNGLPPERKDCKETPSSEARTFRRVVVDRLALETGCAPEQIAIVSQSEWSRGTETAYRMSACGKPYVCTTAAGRTDCKGALAQ
jgi:hypothetical protein